MNIPWPLILLICVLLLGFAVHLFLPYGRSWRNSGTSDNPFFGDDNRNWIGDVLYNNPNDPHLFVPKRYGFGRTVNLGHPLGKPLIFGPLLLPIALTLLRALSHR